MSAILPMVGTIDIPAGATAGDLTFTFLGVVRGSQKVAGGSFAGKVDMVTGGVRTLDNALVQVPVLFPGDFTDRHPLLEVAVSWRGRGVGYSFYVDLLVPDGSTGVDINTPVGGGKPIVLAEQVANLVSLLGRGNALLESLQRQGRTAASAADFAFSAAQGRMFATYAEMDGYQANDGAWASIGLHTYFRREKGAWKAYELSRLPMRLSESRPSEAGFWVRDGESVGFTAAGPEAIAYYQARQPVSFDSLVVPAWSAARQSPVYSLHDDRGVTLAAGTAKPQPLDAEWKVELGQTLAFAPGQMFALRFGDEATASIHVHYGNNGPLDSGDSKLRHLTRLSTRHPIIKFQQGSFAPAGAVGTLAPNAFPVIDNADQLPTGGVARLGNRIVYKDVDGEVQPLVDGAAEGQEYSAESPLPLAALENGEVLKGLPARVAALEQTPFDVEAAQDAAAALFGNQGIYDDANNTLTLNIGGGKSAEEIQDLVAAMLTAGANVSTEYNDESGQLVISAAGGDGSTLGLPAGGAKGFILAKNSDLDGDASWRPAAVSRGIRLRDIQPTASRWVTKTVRPSKAASGVGLARYQVMRGMAISNLEINFEWNNYEGKYQRGYAPGTVITILQSDGTELARAVVPQYNPDNSPGAYFLSIPLNTEVSLSAGQYFDVQIATQGGTSQFYDGNIGGGKASLDGGLKFISSPPMLGLMLGFSAGSVQPKEVIGPLDPADFPVSTVADAPAGSGFIAVDDVAKTARLVWKFSDGSVKGVDLS